MSLTNKAGAYEVRWGVRDVPVSSKRKNNNKWKYPSVRKQWNGVGGGWLWSRMCEWMCMSCGQRWVSAGYVMWWLGLNINFLSCWCWDGVLLSIDDATKHILRDWVRWQPPWVHWGLVYMHIGYSINVKGGWQKYIYISVTQWSWTDCLMYVWGSYQQHCCNYDKIT